MKVLATVGGGYPRIGDTGEKQRLRKAIDKWEKKAIKDSELRNIEDSVTKEVIEEQIEAGVDIPSDGQIRWYDNISHFMRKMATINGLQRFYDTNYLFRQPVIDRKLERKNPILLDEFKFAKSCTSKPIKVVLTGPYTTAMLSLDQHYKSKEKLVMELAEIVAQEIKDLEKAGCKLIQLDEPEILKHLEDFKLLDGSLKIISKTKGKAKLALHTFFGDATNLYEKFQKLPVDILGFDFTYSNSLETKLGSSEKELALGIIDARNTRLEKPEELVKKLKLVKCPDTIYINPSASLEYLPRDVAFEKLKLVRKVADLLK